MAEATNTNTTPAADPATAAANAGVDVKGEKQVLEKAKYKIQTDPRVGPFPEQLYYEEGIAYTDDRNVAERCAKHACVRVTDAKTGKAVTVEDGK